MITHFRISNFKRLQSVELELGSACVFIGPNNSGKTTALQAMALWDMGWRRWVEKRADSTASKRQGVVINRRDLVSIPVPSPKLLWNMLRTQISSRDDAGKQQTDKQFITLEAQGVHHGKPWSCALEFYYSNEESFYCRLKGGENRNVPEGARAQKFVFLPPMSGLAAREFRKEQGELSVMIGEGQTAQVLRNLCWQLWSQDDKKPWQYLVDQVNLLFQLRLNPPEYFKERSELTLTYEEIGGLELDLSSSGRGCQQVILLLCFLLANPGSVLLLDEPDAHLEILRQRDVYNLITEVAASNGSQVIAASHSEVILQEAADRDVVMAFVGRQPRRMDTRSRRQLKKALESIRMADYYLAEQKGWMLYLEGSTDLSILRRLAQRLKHPAQAALNESVPVIYLGNNLPQEARDHFQGLRLAKPELVGFALFDRLERDLHTGSQLTERKWQKREIENYLVTPKSLRAFVLQGLPAEDLIDEVERSRRLEVLEQSLSDLTNALRITNKPDPWGPDIKVTDDFLDLLFKIYYEQLGTPQQTFKRDYHGLADAIELSEIDPEVTQVLDLLWQVAQGAKPAQ